jgi:hypothetical protein
MTGNLRSRVGLAAVLALAALGCGEEDSGPIQSETRIRVTISTTGGAADYDGYMLALGDVPPVRTSTSGTYDFAVDPGTYAIRLTGVAPNCSVPVNPLMVTASEGATVRVTIEVTCDVPRGQIEVSVITSGAVPDSDGYIVTMPVGFLGLVRRNLAPNDTVSLGSFLPRNYSLTLNGIAANCSTSPVTRVASVVPGGLARVTFPVVCQDPAATGTLRLLITTSGAGQDLDGYTVTIDSGVASHVSVNDSLLVTLTGGIHQVRLAGLAPGCAPTEGNPQAITVTNGVLTTAAFHVVCAAGQGRVRFIGTTTGSNVPSLLIGIIAKGAQLVDIVDLNPNGASLSQPHPPGTYNVGVAKPSWCTGGSQVPQVTIVAGSTTDVRFTVNCP